VRDFLECRAGAELHHDAPLAVPPAEAWNLGVVAIEDAGLRERSGRRQSAAIAVQVVSLGVDEMLQIGHVAVAQRLLQRIGAEAVEMKNHELAAQRHSANTGRWSDARTWRVQA